MSWQVSHAQEKRSTEAASSQACHFALQQRIFAAGVKKGQLSQGSMMGRGLREYSRNRASFSSANLSLSSWGQSGHKNLPRRMLWPPEMCSSKNSLEIGSPPLYLNFTRMSWNLHETVFYTSDRQNSTPLQTLHSFLASLLLHGQRQSGCQVLTP